MKKRFGALMLALVLAFSLAIPAGAAVIEESTMPVVELPDEVLDNLTAVDYANAYTDLKDIIHSTELSQFEKDQIAIQKYIAIYTDKMNTPAATAEYPYDYLPTSESVLCDAEKALVKQNPLQASSVYSCALTANKNTISKYGAGSHNDNGDAFRHMLWSALMTKEFSLFGSDLSNGRAVAKKWGDAHEEMPGNPPLEKSMDLKNNAVGRNLLTTSMNTTAKIVDACIAKVKNGGGYRIVNNALVSTNSTGLK